MQVSYPNDVKIYNLSAGKSLPEWISDRKRRKLQQTDVDFRRRIELIQDFDMPDCSNSITTSKDGQYIFACGTYKPKVKCYDVTNLSMKFERCMDAEPIKALTLSEGYEKLIFLQEDRWIELHVQYGKYFRLRIPKFGRDMAYNLTTCDLYVVGSGNEAYRLNLEQGRFMTPFATNATSLTRCDINLEHQLFVMGTWEGCVEAWDPRAKRSVGTLDTTKALLLDNIKLNRMSSISSITFKDALHMAVGTSTGQILLYDIRSNKPYLVKDHNCDLPIKCIKFCSREQDLIMSMDQRVVKVWHENKNGKPYTAVEPGVDLNDLCLTENTGLFFLASESQKVLTYYIPSIGPAPHWCQFLDNITEELEETDEPEVFDDYKFVTVAELEELGLSNLIGSKLLRAYMHGYFIDAKLYNKAKALMNPLAYEDYKKQKIRDHLDKERGSRINVKKLPEVNRELAEKLMQEQSGVFSTSGTNKKQKKREKQNTAKSLLADDRFKALFENKEFEVDKEADEYKLLNPAMTKLEKRKAKSKVALQDEAVELDEVEADDQYQSECNSIEDMEGASTSSEDDEEYRQLVRQTHKDLKIRRRFDESKRSNTVAPLAVSEDDNRPKTYEIKSGGEFQNWAKELSKPTALVVGDMKEILQARLAKVDQNDGAVEFEFSNSNSKEMTFSSKKLKNDQRQKKVAEHVRDRRKLRRSAGTLMQKNKMKR